MIKRIVEINNKFNDFISKIKLKNWQIIIFLFLFSFLLRIFFINEGIFHHDGIKLAQAVENSYTDKTLYGQINGRYGSVILNLIFFIPLKLLFNLENSEKIILFSDVLFASISIVILFLFIKKLFNSDFIAFSSGVLFSVTPVFLSVTTIGKEHGATICFLLLSFFILLFGLEKNSKLLLAISSLLFGFSLFIRESVFVFIPFYFLFYISPTLESFKLKINKEKFRIKNLISIFLPFIILFLVFFIYSREILFRTFFETGTAIVSFLGFLSPVFNLAIKELVSTTSIILILFAFLGLICLFFNNKNKFNLLFFLFWFCLIFYFGNTSGYNSRYLDFILIPFFLFCSFSLYFIYKKSKIIAFLFLLYFSVSMFLYVYPILDFRHSYNGEKRYALFVKENTPENSVIIVMDDGPFIEYYGDRKIFGHPIGDIDETKIWVSDIKNYLKNGTPVYLAESGFSYDQGDIFKNAVLNNFNITVVGSKLIEDYHHSLIEFAKYDARLFKINEK
jgi:hypothetical protein